MKTFADKVIAFNRLVDFTGALPAGISIMNPFKEDKKVLSIATKFYRKYYNDDYKRHLVLGINPGRFGGGLPAFLLQILNACRLSAILHLMANKPMSLHRFSSMI